jgi:hypothetical protein
MKKILLFLVLFYFAFANAQQSEKVTINWKSNSDYNIGETTIKVPQFDLEFYNLDIPLKKIQFRKIVSVSAATNSSSLVISNLMYQTIQEAELYDLNKSLIPNKIQASLEVVRARDDYKGLFNLGTSTYLEVLSAEQSYLSAQLSEVADTFDRMQSVISLYQALGGGREK